MTRQRPIKVVLAKPGLDGHDRGAHVLTLGLRDAGMEVIYLGIRTPAELVVQAAIEEDADVVALSCLSGAHEYHFPRVAELLKEAGATDVLLIGGGVIPAEDVPYLQAAGFKAIFGPGTTVQEIATFIQEHVRE
jgi:methylmalonyl-CoA mutase C-terminal domain/subunit